MKIIHAFVKHKILLVRGYDTINKSKSVIKPKKKQYFFFSGFINKMFSIFVFTII